ncbi:MAG: hypothetical protein JSV05_09260 [Candidatus Bathyarchaeota archaeon]|nr:MAG: hypothetical protein JSV05_09260 [Candidatus Bathyarchaeota archaeon]
MATANDIELTITIPKPIAEFLKQQIKSFECEEDTLEKYIITALIDSIDAQLNNFDVSTRRTVIMNLGLAQILKH